MPSDDEREQALQHAARLKGLALVRAGDAFALAVHIAPTLDEIAAFLATHSSRDAGSHCGEDQRRADLWAMLKAERALIAELEVEKRKASTGGSDHETIEAALAEIRRRIAEIEDTKRAQALTVVAGGERP
jgi:hypothetical protein